MKYHNIPTLFDNQASLINGKNIGTDTVRYIQDAGQKVAGTTYIDKNTNELYVCVTTTNSVNNDGNFSKFNLKEAFNKLDNLSNIKRSYIKADASYIGTVRNIEKDFSISLQNILWFQIGVMDQRSGCWSLSHRIYPNANIVDSWAIASQIALYATGWTGSRVGTGTGRMSISRNQYIIHSDVDFNISEMILYYVNK